MSAITDALRRASSASKTTNTADGQTPPALPPWPVQPPPPASQQPAYPAAASRELPPVIGADGSYSESEAQPRRRSALPLVFALLVLLCVFGAGASYLYAKKNGPVLGKSNLLSQIANDADKDDEDEVPENEIRPNTQSSLANRGATTAAAVPGASSATVSPAPAPATPTPAPTARPTVAPAPTPAAAVPTAPVAPAVPVRFPPLKLQSIYYKANNPSVMINGKTLFVTDEINGVTVADISPSSVTLVLSGQTNILTLR